MSYRKRRVSTYDIGRIYERSIRARTGGQHLGKPGNPDIIKKKLWGLLGENHIEAKAGFVSLPQLKGEVHKGRTHVYSKTGFSEPAVAYAERYSNVKLFRRGRRIRYCFRCHRTYYDDEGCDCGWW